MRKTAPVSGMHHNVLGGFLHLRPAIFARLRQRQFPQFPPLA